MDLNVLVRGQSNALLFADRGGAAALEQGLEARLGVDVHMLYQWGTDTSTIHSATAFMDWDTGGQQASLLRYVRGLSADLRDNPTATVWMHNEYDQGNNGLTTDAWLGEVRADAALVRGALGQDAGTTPYTFVPIRYPYGGNFGAIGGGMEALDADPTFNADISWAAQSLAMNGGPEAGNNASHMGDADAVQLGGSLAESMAGTLRPLAGGSSPSPTPSPTAPTPAQTTLGSGSDTLVLRISQDAYQGSAQYTVKVDGAQIGGTQTAVAWHSSGQSDTLTVKGDWASGGHSVAVEFLNDAWGGTATTDRNLYVDGMTYDGAGVANGSAALLSAGAATFTVQDSTPVPGAAPAPSPTAPAPSPWLNPIIGTSRKNTLVGTDGADRITGLGGDDTLTGKGGADEFVFSAGDGFDVVKDFQSGTDHLLFRGMTASAVTTKPATYSKTDGLDVFYGSGAGDHVFLERVNALAPGDLVFG